VLGLTKEDPELWGTQQSYQRLHTYIHCLTVTIDAGERGVKIGAVRNTYIYIYVIQFNS
jgi:hypothetical protein